MVRAAVRDCPTEVARAGVLPRSLGFSRDDRVRSPQGPKPHDGAGFTSELKLRPPARQRLPTRQDGHLKVSATRARMENGRDCAIEVARAGVLPRSLDFARDDSVRSSPGLKPHEGGGLWPPEGGRYRGPRPAGANDDDAPTTWRRIGVRGAFGPLVP